MHVCTLCNVLCSTVECRVESVHYDDCTLHIAHWYKFELSVQCVQRKPSTLWYAQSAFCIVKRLIVWYTRRKCWLLKTRRKKKNQQRKNIHRTRCIVAIGCVHKDSFENVKLFFHFICILHIGLGHKPLGVMFVKNISSFFSRIHGEYLH